MVAPSKTRNRAREFDDFLDKPVTDFDPEANDDDLAASNDDHDSGTDRESVDENGINPAARDHYLPVQKSRLRRPPDVLLDPRYRGSRVSRDEMEDDDHDDDEHDDERVDGEEDDEGEDHWESEEGEDDGNSENGVEIDGDEEEEDEDEEDTSENEEEPFRPISTNAVTEAKKSQLRDVMREEKSVATSLSKATQADAEKGRAVKKQRLAFDTLLGTRVKLQKALVGLNTLVGIDQEGLESEGCEAIAGAENAAFKLWSSLNDFREQLVAAKTGYKRKRQTFKPTSTTEALWAHMQTQEEDSLANRNAILQKWSAKAGQAAFLPKENGLRMSRPTATIIDAIQQHLTDSDRMLKRARTPRSCAPLQSQRKISYDDKIYDDADFYGQLLKELLEQKSSSADAVPAAIDVDFKTVKTKRNVDTKASKGRKLRYTVHEKLQNFMAPESRSNWGERQADELFGSLFGQRLALADEEVIDIDVDAATNGNGGEIDESNEDFIMFRN